MVLQAGEQTRDILIGGYSHVTVYPGFLLHNLIFPESGSRGHQNPFDPNFVDSNGRLGWKPSDRWPLPAGSSDMYLDAMELAEVVAYFRHDDTGTILSEDQRDTIKLKNVVSGVVDDETQAKIDVVKQRLIKYFGYNETSATDVLNYVASIFARGDTQQEEKS